VSLPQPAENLVTRYEKSALLRALVQLVPLNIGSAIDTAVIIRVQAIRAARTKEFFDELARGDIQLQAELLENNDFLHCFFATVDAALRTNRHEKIRAFSRLLRSATIEGKISALEEYEELLGILDDMSYRELTVLTILDQYEQANPKQDQENDLQRTNRYWSDFSEKVISSLGVLPEELDAIMTRLNRTGCYETFTGGFFDYTGGKGKITPVFRRLKALAFGVDAECNFL
jgi:hypothetical protein